jgi:hypothetical protein
MADSAGENLYHMMLGVPEGVTSPDCYQLLGLEYFEDDEDLIRDAAIDANQKLLSWQNSKYHRECDQIMDKVVRARDLLLSPSQKSKYDRRLEKRLGISPREQVDEQDANEEMPDVTFLDAGLAIERTADLPPAVRSRRNRRASNAPELAQRPRSRSIVAPLWDFLQQLYYVLPLVKLALLAIVITSAVFVTNYIRSLPSSRVQKVYLNRTTSEWLFYVESGKGTSYERDNQKMSLSTIIDLDWAALPDLFEALTKDSTKGIAETVLERSQGDFVPGKPYQEDIVAGLAHPDQLVRLWATRIAPLLADDAVSLLPELEEIRDTGPEELTEAAILAINKIKSGPEPETDAAHDQTDAQAALEEELRLQSLPPELR